MLYRQYLENIRDSIDNYDLDSLEDKNYLSILARVSEIEDMSYIDTILKNAGLDLSFISNNDFLYKPIELKSKLGEVFIEEIFEEEVSEEMKEAYLDYLSNFVDEDDSIISKLEGLFGKNGIKEFTPNIIPQSSDTYLTVSDIMEKNKELLSSMFAGMKAISQASEFSEDTLSDEFSEEFLEFDDDVELDEEETEETEDKETEDKGTEDKGTEDKGTEDKGTEDKGTEDKETEDKETEDKETEDKETEDKETEDKEELILVGNVIEETNILEKVDDNLELVVEDEKSKSKKLSMDFLEDDFVLSEEENINDIEENDIIHFEDFDIENDDSIKNKEFSMFLDKEDGIEDEPCEDSFADISNSNIECSIEEDLSKVLEGRDLDREVSNMYSLDEIEDNEQEKNTFKDATEYFLNGKKVRIGKKNKENLKELYKKKEKIVDIDEVTDSDDALAKFLLAFGDGIMNLPENTSNLIQKFRQSSKKMCGGMVVEEEDNE